MVENEPMESLVARARGGDRGAFGELAERVESPLRGFVAARLGAALRDRLEVDDVVQETLRLGLASIQRFEWRGDDSFVRWLGAIARNVIRKQARLRERGPSPQGVLELPGKGDTPSVALRREERFARLQSALATLPPDHRDVIRLARIEGLKTAEIARRMERSEAAVRQLLFRALRSLRAAFGDTESLTLPRRSIDPGHDA